MVGLDGCLSMGVYLGQYSWNFSFLWCSATLIGHMVWLVPLMFHIPIFEAAH